MTVDQEDDPKQTPPQQAPPHDVAEQGSETMQNRDQPEEDDPIIQREDRGSRLHIEDQEQDQSQR